MSNGQYSTSLMECTANTDMCCYGCFCPCCLSGKNMTKLMNEDYRCVRMYLFLFLYFIFKLFCFLKENLILLTKQMDVVALLLGGSEGLFVSNITQNLMNKEIVLHLFFAHRVVSARMLENQILEKEQLINFLKISKGFIYS